MLGPAFNKIVARYFSSITFEVPLSVALILMVISESGDTGFETFNHQRALFTGNFYPNACQEIWTDFGIKILEDLVNGVIFSNRGNCQLMFNFFNFGIGQT